MLKPTIVISKCFSSPVRYDGGIIKDEFIEKLKKYINYIEVCPEVEIELGVPRDKINIVKDKEGKKLIQPKTNKDITLKMKKFTEKFLKSIPDVDGFILKSKSPSCGISSANYYVNNKIAGKTDGIFAEEVKRGLSHLPVESEGRLKDNNIREHFLIRIFAFSEFRELKKEITPLKLVKFHTRYKYLLLSYHQANLKVLGRIVSEKMDIQRKIEEYENVFYDSFKKRTTREKIINTILHIYGYFKDSLKPNEKKHFLTLIEKYRKNEIYLNVIIELFNNYALRFENEYILNQKFLNPFPTELNI